MTTGFTIPNAPDVSHNDQAEPDAGDFQILSGNLYGVISGCAVAQQGSPNFTVNIASGWYINQGAVLPLTSQTVSHANPGANPRFDLVVGNNTGTASVITGSSADANPRYPVIPDGYTVFAQVYVPVGVANITNPLITDKRKFLDPTFQRALPLAANTAIAIKVQNDAQPRLSITADGTMTWLGDATLARIGTSLMQWTGGVTFRSAASGIVPTVMRAAAGQTADLTQWLDSSGVEIASVDNNGRAIFTNFQAGTGDPNGAVPGIVGDLYRRLDGARDSILYQKESYNSSNPTQGWFPIKRVDPPSTSTLVPIGGIIMWPNATPPSGYLACDGSLISTTTYGGLFAIVGHGYNANVDPGGGNFRLPNYAGSVGIGAGPHSGLTTRTVGQSGGAETVTLTTTTMPSHTHTTTAHDHGAATGIENQNHHHDLALTTSGTDITHHHQDGSHVHYMPGGIANMLFGTSTAGANAINTHAWITADDGPGPQVFTWGPTTGNNLTPSNTSDGGGSHSHVVTGSTSIESLAHLHTISSNTVIVNSAGTGSAHENMPPFTVALYIIRAV